MCVCVCLVTRDSKRFYRSVGVAPAVGLEGVGWVVTLGGRRIQTPSQYATPPPSRSCAFARALTTLLCVWCVLRRSNLLKVPTEMLAQAIALEWDYQNEHISPTNMPLVRATAHRLSASA